MCQCENQVQAGAGDTHRFDRATSDRGNTLNTSLSTCLPVAKSRHQAAYLEAEGVHYPVVIINYNVLQFLETSPKENLPPETSDLELLLGISSIRVFFPISRFDPN